MNYENLLILVVLVIGLIGISLFVIYCPSEPFVKPYPEYCDGVHELCEPPSMFHTFYDIFDCVKDKW